MGEFTRLGLRAMAGAAALTLGVGGVTSAAAQIRPARVTSDAPVCAGLSGDLVTTDSRGDQGSPTHLAAALMFIRYVTRDIDSFLALYVPPGPNRAEVAKVIAEAPVGTKYCVAATRTGPTTVRVVFQQQFPGHTVSGPRTEIWTLTKAAPYAIEGIQVVG